MRKIGDFRLNKLLSSPELYPINIDTRRHLVSFIPMTLDRYRLSSFLDGGSSGISPIVYTFNLDDLLLFGLHAPHCTAAVNYVFHTAYCCSTLLARYLDLIPACFVLKEPSILAQLAMLRPSGNPALNLAQGMATGDEWQSLMNLAIRLLTRTYAPDHVVVIKVNDLCNSIGHALLKTDRRSQIVFLHVPLRTFILSVLKTQSRRVWLRTRLRDTRKAAESFPRLDGIDPASLRDAEGAAYLWLLNSLIYNRLRMGEDSARVLAFDGEKVAENPKQALAEIASFFRLTLPESTLSQLLVDPSVGRYSKNLSVEYNTESRRHDLERVQARFGKEAENGVDWAGGIKPSLEFDGPW